MNYSEKEQIKELYETCNVIMEHVLHDVMNCLLLNHSKEDFFDAIGIKMKSGLNTFGSDLRIYNDSDGKIPPKAYRLRLKKDNNTIQYIVQEDSITFYQSMEEPSIDKIEELKDKAKKKLEAFDGMLHILEIKAKQKEETEYCIADVLNDYKNTCKLYERYKSAMPSLTKKKEYSFQLLNRHLGFIEEENTDQLKDADLSILILIVLGILPKYGKSPRNYDETKYSEDLIAFMENYYSKVGKKAQCGSIFVFRIRKSGNNLNITKFSLIVLLRDFITELRIENIPKETKKTIDELINDNREFNNHFFIEGIWKDENGNYWSIRNVGICYHMYKFISYNNRSIKYQKFKLGVNSDKNQMFLQDFSTVMNQIRGKGEFDFDLADFKLSSSIQKNGSRENVIKIVLTSYYRKFFTYKKLERVDDDNSKNLIKMWDTHDHISDAEIYYCSTMLINTFFYLYVGSYEKVDGKHIFFYKINKIAILGKDFFSIDFDSGVSLIKAIWFDPFCERFYIMIDKLNRFIDVEDLGVSKTNGNETKTIQQLLDMESPEINEFEDEFVRESNSPFSYNIFELRK